MVRVVGVLHTTARRAVNSRAEHSTENKRVECCRVTVGDGQQSSDERVASCQLRALDGGGTEGVSVAFDWNCARCSSAQVQEGTTTCAETERDRERGIRRLLQHHGWEEGGLERSGGWGQRSEQ